MYNVHTAWNDTADGNILLKHSELPMCESFILDFFLGTLTQYAMLLFVKPWFAFVSLIKGSQLCHFLARGDKLGVDSSVIAQ